MTLSGSCVCGAIAYKSTGEPTETSLCHCADCQKWTGSAFTANAVVPAASFKVTKGSPKEYGTVTISEKINHRFFCTDCGTSLFSKLDVMPGHVVIMAGGLDGGMSKLDGKIAIEYFCKNRVGYLQGLAGVKQEVVQG